ncbi:hypothetical protein [Vreelandella arcis]|uniref:Uncharacterized protein n=1 Tax=Vreelandella arcis TaxID=416873 RepID=A0A1H0IA85_9GAMM|nr:hypothetical protein [Halomonas arcis]SDO28374.1 hypothetical protein SAMN04487951_11921 [Halomonas arcis]
MTSYEDTTQLNALLAQCTESPSIRGEVVFWAEGDENRLDHASFFLQNDGQTQLKASGLRDSLMAWLDNLMIQRTEQGQPLARDGLLRLGDGASRIEWLPKGAGSDAADVRRDDTDLLPWLQATLSRLEQQAIAEKKQKALAKHGDEAHWKRMIWRSPEKNHLIKVALAEEGQRLGFQVLPNPVTKRGEWLYDAVWRRVDANRNVIGIPLAVEIEVSDSRLGGIRYDFNKLLQAQADHKLMVFQVKTPTDVEEVFSRLMTSIDAFPHSHPCRYLLAGWCTTQHAFHFNTYDAG